MELDYSTDDGHRSTVTVHECRILEPDAPVVLVKPAMGVRASYYAPLAEPLAAHGLRMASADLRGHGTSSLRANRRTDFGYREMLEADWPAEVAALAEARPGVPVVLLGHSLGGQISVLYAAACPGAVAAVVTCAACSVYWRAYPRGLAVLALTQFAAAVARLIGHFPGERLGFAGREARTVMADWAHQARTGRYRVSGSDRNYMAALAASESPTLIATIPGDHYAPPSAADHLATLLPEAAVVREHLDLEVDQSPHFRWVQQAEPLAERMRHWLLENGIGDRRGQNR